MIGTVDRRILGAFVGVDAITGASVVPAIPVSAPQWNIKPNRSGTYVIFDGPGFHKLTGQFDLVDAWPPSTKFEVTLKDPTQHYLPRRAIVEAPAPIPAIPPPLTTPAGIFAPQKIALYPSAAAVFGPNWAVIHASVTKSGSNPLKGLPWAVLQVINTSDNSVMATGQTGPNGEALLAVIGLTVQANSSGGGPVTVSSVAANITAYFDPTNLTQPSGWIPNPDDVLDKLTNPALVSSSQSVQLSAGQELSMTFSLTV